MEYESTIDQCFPKVAPLQHGHSLQLQLVLVYSLVCQRNPFLEAVTTGSHIVLLGALGMQNVMSAKQTKLNSNITKPEKEKKNTEGIVTI
jgi:hypothetical protein